MVTLRLLLRDFIHGIKQVISQFPSHSTGQTVDALRRKQTGVQLPMCCAALYWCGLDAPDQQMMTNVWFLMQGIHIEHLQESIDSKAADAKESSADYEEKLVSLSAELGKAAQRIQQHGAKLDVIKQVQVSTTKLFPSKLLLQIIEKWELESSL